MSNPSDVPYQRFFDLSLEMLCIAGTDGYFKHVNPTFERLGYTAAELLGMPFIELVHPDDRTATLEELRRLTDGVPTISFENRYRCKDGSYRWLSWSVAPEPSGLLYGIAVDVTAKKAADEASERWAHVFQHAGWGIVIGSRDNKTLEAMNPAFAQMHGYAVEELTGRPIMSVFAPEARAEAIAAIAVANETGRHAFESLHIRKDGSAFPVFIDMTAVKDDKGDLLYRAVHVHDLTERRKGEEAQARLAAIVNDSDDAIIGRALDGRVTSWNRAAERTFGYTADEAIDRGIGFLIPDDRKGEEHELLKRIVAGDRVSHYQTVRRRKDGRLIDVSVTLSPIHDSSGRLVGLSKIARDISALKRIERDLIQARDAAELANRELESFSYSVAHDLRAPLRAIDGFSQALLEDCGNALDEDCREHVRYVREGAQLMAQLIDDILTLSRVSRSELLRETADLSALARAVRERLARSDPSRNVEVAVEDGMVVHGDPRLLTVVLENLMGNAWKFTGRATAARIEVGSRLMDGRRGFFVRDNGAGFDMAYADKLFGVFQRLHAATEFEGTGVGLAIVQRIVHRHGGRVWAEGEVDRGATFFFSLGDEEPTT